MYNILCCYVLVKLIKKHNHKFNVSTRTFLSRKHTEKDVVTEPLDEQAAELDLCFRYVLFKKLDQGTAAGVIEMAIDYGYIERQDAPDLEAPRYLKVLKEGHNLVSGPLYAGVLREIIRQWGIIITFLTGIGLGSGILAIVRIAPKIYQYFI